MKTDNNPRDPSYKAIRVTDTEKEGNYPVDLVSFKESITMINNCLYLLHIFAIKHAFLAYTQEKRTIQYVPNC